MQPAATGASAVVDASGSDSDSTQLSEPGILGSELEDTEEDMSGDLGVAALGEGVNQLLQLEEMEDPETHYCPYSHLPAKGPGARRIMGGHIESGSGKSIWYKGSYLLCRRPPLCVRADIQRVERDSGSLEINTY